MGKNQVTQFDQETYDTLSPGTTGAWKYVSRVTTSTAVCLISKVLKDDLKCRAELSTKNSSNKSIYSHALCHHKIDLKAIVMNEKNNKQAQIVKFLEEKKFNDIWDHKSALSRLISTKGVSINFFKDNFVLNKLFNIAFNRGLPSKHEIRKIMIEHAAHIKNIISCQLKCKTITISFDEWTSRSNLQILNVIAQTD